MSYAVMPMNDWQNIVASVKAKTGKTEGFLSGQAANEIDSINNLNQYLLGRKTEITAEDMQDVLAIREYEFYKRPITSVEIGSRTTQIGQYAFSQTQLTSINIPNNVLTLGASAFSGCSSLTTATLSKSISSIQNNLFYGCSALTGIEIPDSVTSIGMYVFRNCTSLMELTCLAETPPTLHSRTFEGVPADCVIKVPAASVEAYKAAPNWIKRADYITAIEEGE